MTKKYHCENANKGWKFLRALDNKGVIAGYPELVEKSKQYAFQSDVVSVAVMEKDIPIADEVFGSDFW